VNDVYRPEAPSGKGESPALLAKVRSAGRQANLERSRSRKLSEFGAAVSPTAKSTCRSFLSAKATSLGLRPISRAQRP